MELFTGTTMKEVNQIHTMPLQQLNSAMNKSYILSRRSTTIARSRLPPIASMRAEIGFVALNLPTKNHAAAVQIIFATWSNNVKWQL